MKFWIFKKLKELFCFHCYHFEQYVLISLGDCGYYKAAFRCCNCSKLKLFDNKFDIVEYDHNIF